MPKYVTDLINNLNKLKALTLAGFCGCDSVRAFHDCESANDVGLCCVAFSSRGCGSFVDPCPFCALCSGSCDVPHFDCDSGCVFSCVDKFEININTYPEPNEIWGLINSNILPDLFLVAICTRRFAVTLSRVDRRTSWGRWGYIASCQGNGEGNKRKYRIYSFRKTRKLRFHHYLFWIRFNKQGPFRPTLEVLFNYFVCRDIFSVKRKIAKNKEKLSKAAILIMPVFIWTSRFRVWQYPTILGLKFSDNDKVTKGASRVEAVIPRDLRPFVRFDFERAMPSLSHL